jgi:hypothetical protein
MQVAAVKPVKVYNAVSVSAVVYCKQRIVITQIPCVLSNPKVHYHINKSQPHGPILTQTNSVQLFLLKHLYENLLCLCS